MDINRIVQESTGFDWDEFNINKNWAKHLVPWWRCEEVFINEPLILLDDVSHSASEKRFYALGTTFDNRKLFIAFTVRRNKIRPISARDMSRKERRIYDKPYPETDSEV